MTNMAHRDGPPEGSYVIVGHDQLDQSRPGAIAAEAAQESDYEDLSATAMAEEEDVRTQEPTMEDVSASTVHVQLPGRPSWPSLPSMRTSDWWLFGEPGESLFEPRLIRAPLSQPARLAEPRGLAVPAGTRRRVIPIMSPDEPSAVPAPRRDAANDSPASAAVRSLNQSTATGPATVAGVVRPRDVPVVDSPPEVFVPMHVPAATNTWVAVDHPTRRNDNAPPMPTAVPAANYRRSSLEECALSLRLR